MIVIQERKQQQDDAVAEDMTLRKITGFHRGRAPGRSINLAPIDTLFSHFSLRPPLTEQGLMVRLNQNRSRRFILRKSSARLRFLISKRY